jgi:3'-5' exonuclease
MASLLSKRWDDSIKKYVESDYFTLDTVNNTLFFDVETTTRYKTYDEYLEKEPNCAKEFARQSGKRSDFKGMTTSEIYDSNGMLYAQHLQVISIAYLKWDPSTRKYEGDTIGFSSWEEYDSIEDKSKADRDLLIEFNESLYSEFGDDRGLLGGYNILGFDIAVLWWRMMACGIKPHPSLNTVGKRPWNIDWILDLQSWTTPCDHKGLSSFDTVNYLFDIPSSKTDDVAGNHVGARFWEDHQVERINDYCKKDVMSSIALSRRLSEDGVDNIHSKTMKDFSLRMEEKKNG